MLDFLTNRYSATLIGKQSRFKSFIRFLVRWITNLYIPFSYNVEYFLGIDKKNIYNNTKRDKDYLISLTSFPGRINKVWIVIETLIRQEFEVDNIVLWLSKDQFSEEFILPRELLRLQNKGVRIVFCKDDLRSHKKYYYALKERPNSYVITVDDDVFYGKKTIGALVEQNLKYPDSICINRGWRIMYDSLGNVLPYNEWNFLRGEVEPDFDILQTGVGAVLYPPKSLDSLVLEEDLFLKHCKLADDIWLYFMGNINRTRITKTKYDFLVIPILNFSLDNKTLTSINVGENLNDKQFKSMLRLIEDLGVQDRFTKNEIL